MAGLPCVNIINLLFCFVQLEATILEVSLNFWNSEQKDIFLKIVNRAKGELFEGDNEGNWKK